MLAVMLANRGMVVSMVDGPPDAETLDGGFVLVYGGLRRAFGRIEDAISWLRFGWGGPGPLGEARRIVARQMDAEYGVEV
jgi:hypothetical protein